MKNKYYIAALSATALTCAMAHAGDTLATAPSASSPTSAGFNPYIGVGGVYNEYSAESDDETTTGDTTGYEVVGGFDLSHGFSVNGSFERTFGSLSLGDDEDFEDFGADFSITDIRLIVNYTHELQQGLSLVGGLGYGYVGIDLETITIISTEGLMAEVGIKYQSGQFFGGLQYNHLFAMHTAPSDLEDEDLGFIEAYLGVQINESVAATLSVETQVVGDSIIEKDLGIALGLHYSF